MDLPALTAYLSLGAVAGLLAGLFGLGGGIVIVPALFFLYLRQGFPAELCMHLAVGSSLATVVFTSLTSAMAHHRHGAVRWPVVRRLSPGIVAGAALGAVLAEYAPGRFLRVFFGLFELLVAAQLALAPRPDLHRELPGAGGMWLVGTGIGALSTLLGIGGGTLTVPLLVYCNVPIHQAVGTSAACGLPISFAGAIGFAVAGWGEAGLPAGSSGYLYWPAVMAVVAGSAFLAPLGARLAHALPVATLRRGFAAVVAFIGVRMLV
ncbi:MAG: sulfite exporter TauE/SafE family protein [Gammaproteobacteria bacterium]